MFLASLMRGVLEQLGPLQLPAPERRPQIYNS